MIRLTCQKCGKKGISLFEKLLVRKSRNISCKECAAEYNYSWWVGVLINVLAAAFGTLLFLLGVFCKPDLCSNFMVCYRVAFRGVDYDAIALKGDQN